MVIQIYVCCVQPLYNVSPHTFSSKLEMKKDLRVARSVRTKRFICLNFSEMVTKLLVLKFTPLSFFLGFRYATLSFSLCMTFEIHQHQQFILFAGDNDTQMSIINELSVSGRIIVYGPMHVTKKSQTIRKHSPLP